VARQVGRDDGEVDGQNVHDLLPRPAVAAEPVHEQQRRSGPGDGVGEVPSPMSNRRLSADRVVVIVMLASPEIDGAAGCTGA
jgi:hypothetical protein